MEAIKTKNGRWLVKVNNSYGCYAEADGTFGRSVDDIEKEWGWALETWKGAEAAEFPKQLEDTLYGSLKYISEYQQSVA